LFGVGGWNIHDDVGENEVRADQKKSSVRGLDEPLGVVVKVVEGALIDKTITLLVQIN
jgi:hypothetical protein